MMLPDIPWFGPRHGMGWGWAPITWEGQVLTYGVVALCLIVALLGRLDRIKTGPMLYWILGSVAGLVAIAALTGTAPG